MNEQLYKKKAGYGDMKGEIEKWRSEPYVGGESEVNTAEEGGRRAK